MVHVQGAYVGDRLPCAACRALAQSRGSMASVGQEGAHAAKPPRDSRLAPLQQMSNLRDGFALS